MFFVAIPERHMHVELPSGLQNMQLSEYFVRGKVVAQEDLPLKNCSFSWGWGERLYVLYLPGLQTPK